jgi:RNA polymerase sigma-70 factor (ECF subfamily)
MSSLRWFLPIARNDYNKVVGPARTPDLRTHADHFMWPDATETQVLLERVAANDATAAERLWDSYRAPLRRMIDLRLDRVLARRVDASDVVQDVLIRANQRLSEYLRNPVLPFHLWLRQIARDTMIDAHRRHRGAARRSLDHELPLAAAFGDRSSLDLAAQLRDPELTPAAAALRGELQRRFQAALQTLDDDDREIVLLRHFEQLSNSEAARTLGVSEAAAGMRHLRALRRLRAVLGETPSTGGSSS